MVVVVVLVLVVAVAGAAPVGHTGRDEEPRSGSLVELVGGGET